MTRGHGATANMQHPPENAGSRPIETIAQSNTTDTSPAIRLLAQHAALPNSSETRPPLASEAASEAARKQAQLVPSSASAGRHAYYTSVQWTADGTSLIATSSAQTVSSFVLPADLLQPAGEARGLQPQASIRLPEPTQVVAPAPYFSLGEPMTQLLLVGCRDHPIQLYHAFPRNDAESFSDSADSDSAAAAPVNSYKLIRKESEQYITPASLLWENPGTHFICGSANRLDHFDLSRHGSDGPLLTIPTIPSRRHISKGNGVGMKGTVAALSSSPWDAAHGGGSVLAAGTWTRWMGLYDLHRTDRVIANWCVSNAEAGFQVNLAGQGIVQTAWSPCGRYLIINERHASGLLIYDIRVTGQLLSVLRGRKSNTQQRLRCDVFQGTTSNNTGFEVWAGNQDGSVAVWEAVGSQNDTMDPSWTWNAHDSPVGSTVLHPSGSVVATCSGGWKHHSVEDFDHASWIPQDNISSNGKILDESSLKIWSINTS